MKARTAMNKLTVYKQMTSSPAALVNVLRSEQMGKNFLSSKSSLTPFAMKAMTALKTLYITTEAQSIKAANVFLSSLQTLAQAGITAEDFDLMDFVKRDNCIVVSARVELLIRAATRKGYRMEISFEPVPQEDAATTYYKEYFHEGRTFYVLEDLRNNGDRKITPERLIGKYFDKFLCRIEVSSFASNNVLAKDKCEMSVEDVLRAHDASDNGMRKSKWVPVFDDRGNPVLKSDGTPRNKKVFSEELNIDSIWYKWTASMVEKTVIRRALKRIRQALPELKELIYAFDNDDIEIQPQPIESDVIEIPLETANVDLDNLTDQQKDEAREIKELWKANPKLGFDTANEIISMFDGKNAQEIINIHYASIINIKARKRLAPIIQPLFNDPERSESDGALCCSICGKEIKSEKSKAYYAEHPDRAVKCYDCGQNGGAAR